jgi:hypothetical protein
MGVNEFRSVKKFCPELLAYKKILPEIFGRGIERNTSVVPNVLPLIQKKGFHL